MKKLLLISLLAPLGTIAQAQNVYLGLGLPGLATLGYAQPTSENFGLRAEYAGGLSLNKDGIRDGINVAGTLKASRVGAFADFYPFSNGFRLVGGVTFNDIKANLNAVGSAGSTINGKPVDLTGETFNAEVTFPRTTPYFGIGYGHQKNTEQGFGFFADLGVMVGKFDSTTSTTLVGKQNITQADVDAQTQSTRDSISKLSVLPSISLGLVYRF